MKQIRFTTIFWDEKILKSWIEKNCCLFPASSPEENSEILYQRCISRKLKGCNQFWNLLTPSHLVGYCELWARWWGEGGQGGGEGQAAENITSIITMNWDEAFLGHRLEQSQGLVSWGISEFQIDKIWWCVNPRVDVSALNDLYFLHRLTDKSFLRWNTSLSNGGYILRRLSKVVLRQRHRLTPRIFNFCSLHWRGGPSVPCLV